MEVHSRKASEASGMHTMRKVFPPPPPRHRPSGLEILYEDQDLLVIDKNPGLLTVSYHSDETRTAERILTDYVKKGNPKSRNRLFVVHRLDRDTSGLLVFAKTRPIQQYLKNSWKKTEKLYMAAVEGHIKTGSGVLSSYLAENKDQFVHSVKDPEKGKLARTAYAVIKETRFLSIVKVKLLTGRKNQIRVHFSEAGHPVVGDLKYGGRSSPGGRLSLHAKYLSFVHPRTLERMCFETPIPDYFIKMAEGLDEETWAKTRCPST